MLLNILVNQYEHKSAFFVVFVTFSCCYKLPKNLDFKFQKDTFDFEINIIALNKSYSEYQEATLKVFILSIFEVIDTWQGLYV